MRGFLLFLVAVFTSSVLAAQATQQDLEVSFLHKHVYLRGIWKSDKLHFNGAGQLVSSSDTTSPMLSGMDIDKLELKPEGLRISGHRIAIVYDNGKARSVPLQDIIKIEIDVSGDLQPALAAVFTGNIADLAVAAAPYWQFFLTQPVVAHAQTPVAPQTAAATGKPIVLTPFNPSGPRPQDSWPVPLFTPGPNYDDENDEAKLLRVEGVSLVGLTVDVKGNPQDVHVINPLGAGLD